MYATGADRRSVFAALRTARRSSGHDRYPRARSVARIAGRRSARSYGATPRIADYARTSRSPAPRTAAMVLALARPGLTRGRGRSGSRGACADSDRHSRNSFGHRASGFEHGGSLEPEACESVDAVLDVLKHWGIRTLGEFAALPSADLSARLGRQGLAWQAIARGEDTRPLVPTRADERFDATLELEWPIEGLEPLSFVLTRLLRTAVDASRSARSRRRRRCTSSSRLVTRELHTRGVWNCRRRCATSGRFARWRCSISNRIRRRRPSIG